VTAGRHRSRIPDSFDRASHRQELPLSAFPTQSTKNAHKLEDWHVGCSRRQYDDAPAVRLGLEEIFQIRYVPRCDALTEGENGKSSTHPAIDPYLIGYVLSIRINTALEKCRVASLLMRLAF